VSPNQVLRVGFPGAVKSGALKIRIALFALSVALVATGADAQDACSREATFNAIYDFGNKTGDPLNPQYVGAMTQGPDGKIYSTTPTGGSMGGGTTFKLAQGGKLTVLADFTDQPYSGLTLGTDGNFYGTTSSGGTLGAGSVFKMAAKGVLTTLYNFTGGNDGKDPMAPPIEGTDGNFYGTTNQGGAHNVGTVYQLSPSGALTTLYQFDGAHGASPVGALVQGVDGYLYGTTVVGNSIGGSCSGGGCGTVFKVLPSGSNFRVLHVFVNDGNGTFPYGALVQGGGGKFYGTTQAGAPSGAGVIFSITSNGSFTPLYQLNGGTDGGSLYAGLAEAPDGNFYGVTSDQGIGYGTFFRMTPRGKFTVCESFNSTKGANGSVTPIQHTNGTFYGDTSQGGPIQNFGVAYAISLGYKPFVSLLPASGKVGATIGVLGQGFTGASVVSFNGKAATKFTIVSDTFLTAVVPSKATSGFVTVTAPGGGLQSNKKFRVTKTID